MRPYRILVDITHPAHVHFFRNAIDMWRSHGHEVFVIARDKDITIQLLDGYGYQYTCFSKMRRGFLWQSLEVVEHEAKIFSFIQKHHPDVIVSISGIFSSRAGALTGTPVVIFYDTENATISNAVSYPFATNVCTPDCYKYDIGQKHIRYKGYHELAYLHPNRFTPNPKVLEDVDIKMGEMFSVVRFVSWTSNHDINLHGFSLKGKEDIVKLLHSKGKVIITSESPLPSSLEQYRVSVSPTKIHDLLAFATIVVGESATMASESVMLGTPAIYVSPVGRGYTDEQEKKYEMCFTFSDENKAFEKVNLLLSNPNLKLEWAHKREKLLSEKIDVTAWMVQFIEDLIAKRCVG